MPPLPWHARPGLAGGIDKTGERAAELLGLGFGSVEFGSVTASDLPALLQRLLAVDRLPEAKTAIGIGLTVPPDLPPAALAAAWREGLAIIANAPPVADYLSLNLSAAANRRFLAPETRAELIAALAGAAQSRPAHLRLAVKLPLANAPALCPVLAALAIDQATLVLPDGDGRAEALRQIPALTTPTGPALVAVGGIRDATAIAHLRALSVAGVQVHRLFVEYGAGAVERLVFRDANAEL